MEFPTPATKEQMYATLKNIYNFYRIQRTPYSNLELEPLSLNRITISTLTPAQTLVKANTLVEAEFLEYFTKEKQTIEDKIEKYSEKLEQFKTQRDDAVQKIEDNFDSAVNQVSNDALKKNMANSSVIADRITALNNDKNDAITKIQTKFSEKIADCSAYISSLQTKLSQFDTFKTDFIQKKVQLTNNELRSEQDRLLRESLKYNNDLTEKEIRHSNNIIQANASLRLKYLEINTHPLSKEQLVEMGYYQDVINCVCAYYDTLSPLAAFQQISSDRKVAIYLEDYYKEIVYAYQVKV